MRDHRSRCLYARPHHARPPVRVEVALTELKRVRLIVAYPHDSYVRPGVGDDLISRLMPYLPPLPIMLVSEGSRPRAYAAFQTDEFLALLPSVKVQRFEVDLSAPPEDEEDDLPF